MVVIERVTSALRGHPTITAVRLVGSRQRGNAGDLSDWDFQVDTADFEAAAGDLPALVSPLQPLAQQWDRLSKRATYMLILRGAIKVDLLFDQPHEPEPAWQVSRETLRAVDNHFWDWILWLAAKHSGGKQELMKQELAKMSSHLLRPMGVKRIPDGIQAAISMYTSARRELENRFGVAASKELEDEVRRALRMAGYEV